MLATERLLIVKCQITSVTRIIETVHLRLTKTANVDRSAKKWASDWKTV